MLNLVISDDFKGVITDLCCCDCVFVCFCFAFVSARVVLF